MKKGRVFLLIGKVSSGKTTFARKRESAGNAIMLSLDELQISIYGANPSRQELDDSYEGCRSYQRALALKLLNLGLDVYLDWGFWESEHRKTLKDYFLGLGYEATTIYFSVENKLRRAWNLKRNMSSDCGSFKLEDKDIEYFDSFFEEPDESEYDEVIVKNIS